MIYTDGLREAKLQVLGVRSQGTKMHCPSLNLVLKREKYPSLPPLERSLRGRGQAAQEKNGIRLVGEQEMGRGGHTVPWADESNPGCGLQPPEPEQQHLSLLKPSELAELGMSVFYSPHPQPWLFPCVSKALEQ